MILLVLTELKMKTGFSSCCKVFMENIHKEMKTWEKEKWEAVNLFEYYVVWDKLSQTK